ncbi:uncharacterized protein YALI1_D11177g [Yarrowia lipolytica]|jgi:hypothetical protein|nr:hypothetical protein YALI1_D11177g [Yarrowia lipolytica]
MANHELTKTRQFLNMPPKSEIDDETKKKQLVSILAALEKAPIKATPAGIRKLAQQRGLEVFGEDLAEGTRISLGGSTILIDIDMITSPIDRVVRVNFSVDAKVAPSDPIHSYTNPEISPSINDVLLSSLQASKLDKFARHLAFLSDMERLSSEKCNSFRAIDEVAHALFFKYKKLGKKDSPADFCMGFGQPLLNYEENLGLFLKYWTTQHQVRDAEKAAVTAEYIAEFGLRENSGDCHAKYSTGWINEGGEWQEIAAQDSTAEFVLRLNPPVLMNKDLATKLGASYTVVGNDTPFDLLGNTFYRSFREVHTSDSDSVRMNVEYSNLVAKDELVSVTEVPVDHPRSLESLFDILRTQIQLSTVLESVLIKDSMVGQEELDTNDNVLVEELLNAGPVVQHADEGQRLPLTVSLGDNNGLLSLSVEVHAWKTWFDVVIDKNKLVLTNLQASPGSTTLEVARFGKLINFSEDLALSILLAKNTTKPN